MKNSNYSLKNSLKIKKINKVNLSTCLYINHYLIINLEPYLFKKQKKLKKIIKFN